MKLSINFILKVLIIGALTGQIIASGLFFPLISFTPAFLILLVLTGFIVLFKTLLRGRIVLPFGTKTYTMLMVGILFCMFFACTINGKFFNDTFALGMFCFLFGIACFETVNYAQDITIYFNCYVSIVLLSVLVQFGQNLNISFCYKLWYWLNSEDTLQAFAGTRYLLGLTANPIKLAYFSSVAYALVFMKKFSNKYLLLKWILLIAFFISTWLSQTRSAVFAIVIVTIWGIFSTREKTKILNYLKPILILSIIFGGIYCGRQQIVSNIQSSRFVTGVETIGTRTRLPMILTAFNHALYHPLGMGVYERDPHLVVDASGAEFEEIMIMAPHNLFANCVANYGFIALLILIAMYYQIFKTYRYSQSKRIDSNSENLYKTAFACILTFFINSCFHNDYLLSGNIAQHFFIGILFSVYKLHPVIKEDPNVRK